MKLLLFFIVFVPFAIFSQDISQIKLFSGTTNPELAEAVAQHLGIELSQVDIEKFNDGEIKIKIRENIRNRSVLVMQSTCTSDAGSVNDSLMELYLLIRTMKRASAGTITAIIPYFGYSRQDRKSESRVPISASDVAMLLEQAGADHIIAIDLHCGQIQGFFRDVPVDNLFPTMSFLRHFLKKKDLVNPVIVSPDAGGVARAKLFLEGLQANDIQARLAIIVKQRAQAGVIDTMNLVGDVSDCDAIIIDDICDTAGTLVQAAKELKNRGARRIFACITHPVFSDPALTRIANSCITELVVTDTIPARDMMSRNITQLSIAPLIAEAIYRSQYGESLSHLFALEKINE